MTRTTRITIETESMLIVRRGRTVVAWCPECRAEVEVMLLGGEQSAAQLLGGLAGTALHVWTPAEGETQVCLPSLFACGQSNEVMKFTSQSESSRSAGDSSTTEGEGR